MKITLTPQNAGEKFADKVAANHQQPTRNQKEQPFCPAEHLKHWVYPQLGIEGNPKHPINMHNLRHAYQKFQQCKPLLS